MILTRMLARAHLAPDPVRAEKVTAPILTLIALHAARTQCFYDTGD